MEGVECGVQSSGWGSGVKGEEYLVVGSGMWV